MSIFAILEDHPEYFDYAWWTIVVFIAVVFFFGGRKAASRFPKLDDSEVRFRERYASGHSNKSFLTKAGGANKVLEVVVTGSEVWIRGIWPMFTFIGTKYDLTHRVPFSRIRRVRVESRKVLLEVENEKGTISSLELSLRDPDAFVRAVGA